MTLKVSYIQSGLGRNVSLSRRFACFQFDYPSLKSQFAAAGLSPYNNLWWHVHDFTPVEGARNWSLLGEMYKVHDFLPLPSTDKFKNLEITTDRVRR